VLVLKINYTKHLDRARKSVRYHAYRTREVPRELRGMFDRDSDHADVTAFIKSLDDPLTQPKTVRNYEVTYPVMHRLMFSLSRQEFEACGLTSWKPVIREALGAFERYHGIRLEWVAAEHLSRDHPHVHVDIKSVYVGADGKPHRLRITKEMRQHLRWAVEGIMKRERARLREERWQELQFSRGVDRFLESLGHGLTRGMADAARDDDMMPDPFRTRRAKKRAQERRQDDRER
jgi:hypothetical protein